MAPEEMPMLTVEDLMTRAVVTLNADDALLEVDDLLKRNHIRHLPVLQGRRLVGLVSHRDLIRALARQPLGKAVQPLTVKDVMTPEVESVAPQTSLLEALERLLDHRFGCLPVVDAQGALVGIVTESDFLRLAHLLLKRYEQRSTEAEPALPRQH
jgi:CBS domain-containing membrane protein